MSSLKLQLQTSLVELRSQQEEVVRECRANGVNPYSAKTPSGEFVLAPFLVTRAQILCALASLETT